MFGRTSLASKFNIYKFSEVLVLRGMEKVIRKRDDFVVDSKWMLQHDIRRSLRWLQSTKYNISTDRSTLATRRYRRPTVYCAGRIKLALNF